MFTEVFRRFFFFPRKVNTLFVVALVTGSAACVPATRFDLEIQDVRVVDDINFSESNLTELDEHGSVVITLLTTAEYYNLATAGRGSQAGFILEPCDGSKGGIWSKFYVIRNGQYVLLNNTARPPDDSTEYGRDSTERYYAILNNYSKILVSFSNGQANFGNWQAYTGVDSSLCIHGAIWSPIGYYAQTETLSLPLHYSDAIIEFLERSG